MTLFKIEWQTNKKSLLVWSVSLSIIIFLFMSIFPSMENSGMKEMMTTKLDSLPENMLKAFHLNTGPSLVEPTGFFAYVFQYLFIASSLYAVILGSKALVKEETEGSIDYLFSQPISRRQIVIEKFLAFFSLLSVFWISLSLVSLSTTFFFNNKIQSNEEILTGLLKIFITEFFVLIFFLCLGFLFSSLLKRTNQGMGMGIVFLLYLGGIVGDLQDNLSFLKELSPMAQANPAVLLGKELDVPLILILLIISLGLLLTSLLIYERKDLES